MRKTKFLYRTHVNKLKTMRPLAIRSLFIALLVFTATSCLVPTTKEDYLRGFERFVQDVEKNGEKFSRSDWRWANKKFSRYTDEFYDKFRDELTLEERMEVTLLKGRYLTAKGASFLGRIINKNLKKDVDKLSEEVKRYLDENLDEDLEGIKKGAREIGDSAVKVMEEVLKELKKKKE